MKAAPVRVALTALLLLATLPGCSCGPDAPPEPSPEPVSAPDWPRAPGAHRVALLDMHGVAAAAAFSPDGRTLWVVDPFGKSAVPIAAPGRVGDPLRFPGDFEATSLVVTAPDGALVALDPRRRRLLRQPPGEGAPSLEELPPGRPPGRVVATPGGGHELQDPALRPLREEHHPALRGLPLPTGRYLRAGIASGGPMLFSSDAQGNIARARVFGLEDAERIRVVGLSADGNAWLMVEKGPPGAVERSAARVTPEGKLLVRTAPPPAEDSAGRAGPGKGTGRPQAAAEPGGGLAWARPTDAGLEVWFLAPPR